MIPLTDFAYRRVLDGARVPLRDTRTHPMRFEWVYDGLLLALISDNAWGKYPIEEFAPHLALDPTDPDVARLIDRRIAEAFGYTDVHAAMIDIHDGQWRMIVYSANPTGARPVDAPFDVEPRPENLPLARAALLCALYPSEPR